MSFSASVTPTPDGAADGGSGCCNGDEWRAGVQQAYRSAEVREIATVLASLEPGASSGSKLMLAMRFEDAIFTSATSLADYRKRLTKRLKKLKKNYVPAAATNKDDREQRIATLKHKYADALLYIYKNAAEAVASMKEKSGSERAHHLKQHIDNAKSWGMQLGVLGDSTKSQTADLDRLQLHLEQRVDNIRSHVVKLTDPDLFLKERLHELDDSSSTYRKPETARLIARTLLSRFQKMGWTEFQDPPKTLRDALEKALATVPPPSRDPRSRTNAALAHLEALRAASQALLAYLASGDTVTTDTPKNVLDKCHARAVHGIAFLQEEMPHSEPAQTDHKLTLEDAWTKVMEMPQNEAAEEVQRVTVIKSRVLLVSGRPCPANLLPALKRKGAELVDGTHLKLDFDDAFFMTVYLIPLVATIHPSTAAAPSTATSVSDPVAVWGAEGTWETLGHVVQDRLDHASAHATRILRTCFAPVKGRSDFEVEVAEATALLQFLQLVRTTYMPNWQDVEDSN